jgi:diguanylate cyclase (GGDEF)-like protein/PAS domain S-box-containing protein
MQDIISSDHHNRGSFIVDRRGTILGFDKALEVLTGWPAVEVVGRNKEFALHSDPTGEQSLQATPFYEGVIPMTAGTRTIDLTLHCHNGRTIDVEALAHRLIGAGERLLVTVQQVLARSASTSAASQFDLMDALTGLPNRDAFGRQLTLDLDKATRSVSPLTLLLVDIDHLRDINDQRGRQAGDEVLLKLASILRVSFDDEHRVFRLGDDDFAILLPEHGRGDARLLASTLRSTVERFSFYASGGLELQLTLSLGAASFPADADHPADLVERAQEALNEARAMGRNRVWCYMRKPRVPLNVPVFFDGAESLLVGYTQDLSPSGIFIQTEVPLDADMRCALAFPLPGLDNRVHVIGRVVRTITPEASLERSDSPTPGMGIEFERFSGSNDRDAIFAYLHGGESTGLRPETGVLST